ncbi:MAG TPA: cytochrome c [Verrucomicrobiae bacterium]|nr:cytochrome c [Verrucomicrobiae bacterium]
MERLTRAGLAALCAALLCACSSAGNASNNAAAQSDQTAASPAASAAGSAAPVQNGAMANDGASVYAANCSSCHQANGTGVTGAFPPLAGSPMVTGDAATTIHIVKFGLHGPIAVLGATYNGVMPNWGQNLSDAQIASVVTFIRSAWNNKASAVSVADVSAVTQ